ncbi:hypothetical protein HDIA_4073 [Hartmannibacter diazotrophicus]|uniref:Uncharacterized protein n=1 Tax=Hartmannibacter diazotrophicus TaxID=1482074 RepID=A0A2C9DBB1_9HYPH|nr:hypothetical protein [Hartmannibacter diazotrophicus]SON57614.1 hypothetical protein HDIA_4073 [Hartmannibacter diazotrophicus]
MSSFSTDWLDLREPADHAARDPALCRKAIDWINASPGAIVVDLGGGTGSTLRAMPDLGRSVNWRLVDHDSELLAAATGRHPKIETFELDLRAVDRLPMNGARLVTASALVDLVSADWLDAMSNAVAKARTGLYASLSYDGYMAFSPYHAHDLTITSAFNQHQRSDKGFGPALGPDATLFLRTCLELKGYKVETARSDWRLDGRLADLCEELVKGIAGAAVEAGFEEREAVNWLDFRMTAIPTGEIVIGHLDLLGLPS